MQKSIDSLKGSTTKNQAKTKMNINKRRNENNHLIKALDQVRSRKKQYEKMLEEK
jgi:hypothetical protein